MDTIIKKDVITIRRMFIAFFLLFCVPTLYSQYFKDSLSNSGLQRRFQLQLFESIYKPMPSMLNQSNLKSFTYGSLRYTHTNGGLQHPQKHKKQNGFQLKTASLAELKNTSWTLYGELDYENSRNEEVETNLSYKIYEYNSPYFFFQKRTGFWNFQNYSFNVIGANRLNDRLSIGGELNYKTQYFYRKTDTRNNQQDLTMSAKVATSYKLNKENIFSVGLATEYLKLDSEISNHFPENKHLLEYRLYLNLGLGTYNKNIIGGAITKRDIHQIGIYWKRSKINKTLHFLTATKFGEERWVNKNINKVGENNSISKYNFFDQDLKLFYNVDYDSANLFLNLDVNYLKGVGKIWETENGYYNTNFRSSKVESKLKVDFLFENQFLSQLGTSITYVSNKNNDANYGYQLNSSFIKPEIKIGVSENLTKKGNFFALQRLNYTHVLKIKHKPFAANNLFVDWIGNPVANYLGSSYFTYNTTLGFSTKLNRSHLLEILAQSSFTVETNNKLNKLSRKEEFKIITLGVNYFF